MKTSIAAKLLVALVAGLITVFVIDPLDPSTISTPFMLGIILMALSLRQSTSLVAAASMLYSFLTIYALIKFHRYHEIHDHVGPHPYFWLFQRMGLFIVLCGLSIYLAFYRTGAERILAQLQTILSKLPTPVILSNISGTIVYANDAVRSVFNHNPADVTGKSYFDFIHSEAMKGKSIRAYFEIFESNVNGVYSLEIVPFGPENRTKAQIILVGTGRSRLMITVLLTLERLSLEPVTNKVFSPVKSNP